MSNRLKKHHKSTVHKRVSKLRKLISKRIFPEINFFFNKQRTEEIHEIFTTFSNSNELDSICKSKNGMKWTTWNSACNATSGSDFEILIDHQKFFG